jgi:hypothetical protein
MTTDGSRLITTEVEYDINNNYVGARVVVRDLFASSGTTIRTHTVGYAALHAAGGWVYGTDGEVGNIWRWQSGQPVEVLVTGEPAYQIAVNQTHMYWNAGGDAIRRRTIAGPATVEPFASSITTWTLHARDDALYVGTLSAMWRYPTAGGPGVSVFSGNGAGAVTSLVEDNGFLYFPDLYTSVWRHDLSTSANNVVASTTAALSRPIELIIGGNRVYVIDQAGANGHGIYRAPKNGMDANLVKITPPGVGAFHGIARIGAYLHWGMDNQLWRCEP